MSKKFISVFIILLLISALFPAEKGTFGKMIVSLNSIVIQKVQYFAGEYII